MIVTMLVLTIYSMAIKYRFISRVTCFHEPAGGGGRRVKTHKETFFANAYVV